MTLQSRNFTLPELYRYYAETVPTDKQPYAYFLMGIAQTLRAMVLNSLKKEVMFKIGSGYRDQDHNKQVGGTDQSLHIWRNVDGYFHCAFDMTPLNANIEDVFDALKPIHNTLGEVYLNRDSGCIHIAVQGKKIEPGFIIQDEKVRPIEKKEEKKNV